MAIKEIIKEIEQDVIDVTNTDFVHSDTSTVPRTNDGGLTFERGAEKKGKRINTCVLFVDIRNSVALTEKHKTKTMGKIYTAFTKAVLKAAKHHNGHIRNIIGDRVMVVFPSENCFTNAVDCAISINHISEYVIKKQFSDVDFKCGIGIDYGELRVIKVGIQRSGAENSENKGLVWVGYPANIASRLTDMANKSFEEKYYEVKRRPLNSSLSSVLGPEFGSLYSPPKAIDTQKPTYSAKIETINMTPEEFASNLMCGSNGDIFMYNGKLIKFEPKTNQVSFPSILMTDKVFNGYKKANASRNDITNNWWKEQKHKIDNVSGKIYGGDLHWKIN